MSVKIVNPVMPRQTRSAYRLRLSERLIARTLGVSNGVVHSYLRRARLAGLTWPLPESLDDEALERLLFPPPAHAAETPRRPVPDWALIDRELRRPGVTLVLLWEE